MSLAEMKEVIKILAVDTFVGMLLIYAIAYVFAKVTYKIAHKTAQKQHRSVQKKTEIIYNLGDTKNMTLQEIQELRCNLERSLKGAM